MYAVHQVANTPPTLDRSMARQLCILSSTSRPHVTSAFASSQTLPKASNATATPILQAIGTRSSQRLTPALKNLGADG
eukprot:CCRYP_006677-RC/>CCRYP_006677-RC protein AED:0.35 eAED:1.00 QI:0/-1/0/1/-1/0/1/0/77